MAISCGCGDCKDCTKVLEHVASLLPIRVVETALGKPLRIAGVAMAAGISRNFNVYTPDELQAFAEKLVGAPVYIEHVTASSAAGKAIKAFFDPVSRCVLYEAEIYDQAVADKIRNGLIQHVSVGADYTAVDLINAQVPHGLYNPELSLVAVPGVPETTIQVLESLQNVAGKHVKVVNGKLAVKELLQDLQCVFCGKPGEYLVSVCSSCGDNAQSLVNSKGVESLEEKELDKLAEKVVTKLKVKEAVILNCPKCSMDFDFAQWEANGWKCPSAACGVEVVPPTPVTLTIKGEPAASEKLASMTTELTEKTEKLTTVQGELASANVLLEKYRKVAPSVELLVNPEPLIPQSKVVSLLEGLQPALIAERSSLGMQRQGQAVRAAVLKVKEGKL